MSHSDGSVTTAMAPRQPLTEQILQTLPGPRLLWVALWAAGAFIRPLVLFGAIRLADYRVMDWHFVHARVISSLVVAYMTVLAIGMVARLARGVEEIEPDLTRLTGERAEPGQAPAIDLGGRAGPILLTLLQTAIVEARVWLDHGPAVAAIMAPIVALVNVPLMTAFYAYVALLAGLDRLGRRRLALNPFPADRSLGLRPVGALALTGFWLFQAGIVPFLLVSARDRLDLAVGIVIFLTGVWVFFLSLNRIHRQMVTTKRRYVAWANSIYARAVEPVRSADSIETLRTQAPLMGAAEALERRAEAILEWPFDERTNARIVTLITAVVGALISRFLMARLGM